MAEEETELIQNTLDFNSIPEGCVAAVVALTTPRDACRFALVSRDFLSASESDAVWQQFLPHDCDLEVSRSDAGEAILTEYRKKNDLYMRLADRPLLVDAASKSFWLEKSSGRKCWMIGARSLSISWSDTALYWKWTSIPESRFPEVAELVNVCWIEISLRIKASTLSPCTQYAAYIVYTLTPFAHGFNNAMESSVGSTSGDITTRLVYFTDLGPGLRRRASVPLVEALKAWTPIRRRDGWTEVKIGEFLTEEEDDEVSLRVAETDDFNWKSGFIVEGVELRPAQG